MRKTVIVGALAFVLGGGAVFIYLSHSAQSTAYATLHATASRHSWRGLPRYDARAYA